MQQVELGRTSETIPQIGVGTWNFKGDPGLLRKAVDLGASLIDTAEYYQNEELVGQAIRDIRSRVFVATKVNHWRRSDVMRSAEDSLRKLGVECIDLYQLHWPNGAVPLLETMSAMEDLVDQGKVRFLGVSNFSISEMKAAQRVLRRAKIVSNQVRYSLIERTIEARLLSHCQREGITIMAYSPLGHSFSQILANDRFRTLQSIAQEIGKSPAQVALNWCVRHFGVMAIPKTESQTHLTENCSSSGWRLTDDQINRLDRHVRFRRRSGAELVLRRIARNAFQRFRTS